MDKFVTSVLTFTQESTTDEPQESTTDEPQESTTDEPQESAVATVEVEHAHDAVAGLSRDDDDDNSESEWEQSDDDLGYESFDEQDQRMNAKMLLQLRAELD